MLTQDEKCHLIASTDCDVVVLTETQLSRSVPDAEMLPDTLSFNIFRKDRTSYREGGDLIAIKESLKCNAVNILSPLESQWFCCAVSLSTVIIGVFYRPPHSGPFFLTYLNDAFDELYLENSQSSFLLFKEFNFPPNRLVCPIRLHPSSYKRSERFC